MHQSRSVGRPLLLNQTLVNSICRAAEDEILPQAEVCRRFNILYQTYQHWLDTGVACQQKPETDLTPREKLCVEMSTRLDQIYQQHQKNCKRVSSHLKTPRLPG